MTGKAATFLAFLWFLWFMNFSVRTVFSPLMPLIEDEFLISHARASSLFVYASTGYAISMFFSGMLCGHFGYRRSILVSLGTSAALFFLIPHISTFSVLCALVLVLGLSTGIYLPSIIPLITESYEERYWGRSIAIHDSAASVSILCIPFIVLLCLQFLPWRHIFTIFGAIFALNAVVFSLLSTEVRIHRATRAPLMSFVRNKSLWLMGIVWTFATGANLGIYYVTPLYLTKELLLDMSYANKLFGITRIGGVVCAVLSGFIVDRFSIKKTLFILVFATGLLTIVMTMVDVKYLGIALFAQASIIMGFFPIGLVAISRMFGREQRSMATGFIVTLGVIFGLGIAPYLLGVAGDTISFRYGILIFGILVTLASGLVWFLKELK
jgi:MFS family permease